MKNKLLAVILFFYVCNIAYSQKSNPTQLQSFLGKQIVSIVDIVSNTQSSTIGINDKSIETIPTGRKQVTKRLITFQKDGQVIKAIFTIQQIKATLYGGDIESIYDSDNAFERSGVAAIFATRFDPFVGKKFVTKYDNTGRSTALISDESFGQVWGAGIAKINSATKLSGIFQASAPASGWQVGKIWVDTLSSLKSTFINTYKITEINNDIIKIKLTGKSKPIVIGKEQGSTYNGILEVIKTTGFIQQIESERESEDISEAAGVKISSVTTTKTIVKNSIK